MFVVDNLTALRGENALFCTATMQDSQQSMSPDEYVMSLFNDAPVTNTNLTATVNATVSRVRVVASSIY